MKCKGTVKYANFPAKWKLAYERTLKKQILYCPYFAVGFGKKIKFYVHIFSKYLINYFYANQPATSLSSGTNLIASYVINDNQMMITIFFVKKKNSWKEKLYSGVHCPYHCWRLPHIICEFLCDVHLCPVSGRDWDSRMHASLQYLVYAIFKKYILLKFKKKSLFLFKWPQR